MILLRNPWFLVALLFVAVIWWDYFRKGQRPAIRFPGVSRLKTGGRSWSLRGRYILPVLRSVAVILLVIAIARPQKADEETRVTTEGIAIQLVVDRSGSMVQEDFVVDDQGHTQSRLQAVKDVVRAFVRGDGKSLPGRQDDLIGMIGFATWPDTECPLTRDHAHLIRALDAIAPPESREASFTAIGDALLLAVERIREVGRKLKQDAPYKIKSQIVVLLTDGENNTGKHEPLKAAEAAAALGIKVYTIGVAPEFQEMTMGGFLMQPQKVKQPVEVDERTMTKISEVTGGKYFRAKDKDSLRRIYADIDQLERSVVDERSYYQYEELAYKWLKLGPITFPPILLAALLSLAAELILANTRFRRIP